MLSLSKLSVLIFASLLFITPALSAECIGVKETIAEVTKANPDATIVTMNAIESRQLVDRMIAKFPQEPVKYKISGIVVVKKPYRLLFFIHEAGCFRNRFWLTPELFAEFLEDKGI